jgi:cystathionine beta-synthase
MFNNYWLQDLRLIERKHYGDLRDIISRRYDDNSIIYALPNDTLKSVYAKFKHYDISQLPVLNNNKVVGIIDESDLLLALCQHEDARDFPVEYVMTKKITTIFYTSSKKELANLLITGLTAIVVDDRDNFEGLITKIDFINYLQQTGNVL